MKADEVLERYREGERDFRPVNLRGQSFKGKNLSRADFSEADIRGANFTNANLSGANFHGALAGLQHRWAIGLVLASCLISGTSTLFSALTGYFVSQALNTSNPLDFSVGITSLIVLTVLFIVTIRYGLAASLIAVAVAVAFAFATLGVYVGWRGLAGDEKHAWLRSFAIAFAATAGTSFRSANLTDADFTSATLKSTDFRSANLTRTSWKQAKKLDRVRPGTTYLTNARLWQWLIGKGQNKDFERQDLRGVNLKGANLADASFNGANLSEANLQDADLSRAKLVQTQLDETDLTGATLTGACIEDWGITSHTKLDGVRCEYVYMRLVKAGDPDQNPRRQPDNWNETFQDGDFAETYSLYTRPLPQSRC